MHSIAQVGCRQRLQGVYLQQHGDWHANNVGSADDHSLPAGNLNA